MMIYGEKVRLRRVEREDIPTLRMGILGREFDRSRSDG